VGMGGGCTGGEGEGVNPWSYWRAWHRAGDRRVRRRRGGGALGEAYGLKTCCAWRPRGTGAPGGTEGACRGRRWRRGGGWRPVRVNGGRGSPADGRTMGRRAARGWGGTLMVVVCGRCAGRVGMGTAVMTHNAVHVGEAVGSRWRGAEVPERRMKTHGDS